MKILFVGDVHNHMYMFNDIAALDEKYNFDNIIFFGDYVDDWNTSNYESLQTLDEVIELKKSNKDKYTLLLGNHEISYLGYPCSGHDFKLDRVVKTFITSNINLFDFYKSVYINDKEYVCTHAGIVNDYIYNVLNGSGNWKLGLNRFNKSKLDYISNVSYCNELRGGMYPYSSFVWADRLEHKAQNYDNTPLIPYQIIGHTPVSTITFDETTDSQYVYVDTHSTYRNGDPFGDKSYLMWNKDKFEIIYNN